MIASISDLLVPNKANTSVIINTLSSNVGSKLVYNCERHILKPACSPKSKSLTCVEIRLCKCKHLPIPSLFQA